MSLGLPGQPWQGLPQVALLEMEWAGAGPAVRIPTPPPMKTSYPRQFASRTGLQTYKFTSTPFVIGRGLLRWTRRGIGTVPRLIDAMQNMLQPTHASICLDALLA